MTTTASGAVQTASALIVTAAPCRIVKPSSPQRLVAGGASQENLDTDLVLPVEIDVQIGDEVRIGDDRYQIVGVQPIREPRLSRKVSCKRI
jgi:hypothetical protein